MRRILAPLLIASLLAAPACFRPRSGDAQPAAPSIEVRNRYFGAIVAYLMTGGTAVRLGMVQSNRTETFDFPIGVNPYGTELRLVADPIGDFEAYISDAIVASSGTTIVLTVENELRHSSVIIR